MLLSALSVLVVAQLSSEIPEGLMNNLVYQVCMSAFVLSSVKNVLEYYGDLKDKVCTHS